jgi:exodeoxyribonuclease-3
MRDRALGDASGSGSCRQVDQVRVFTLNISGPSLERADRFLKFFDELDVDVLVLTETRPMPGTTHLLETFRRSGYGDVATTPASRAERGVALVHRASGVASMATPTVELTHRLVVARMEAQPPITLVGAYVPSRDASPHKIARKQTFLTQTTELLRSLSGRQELIFVGDLNVVHRSHVPRYPSFRAWEYDFLDGLEEDGFVDIFAELHPGVQAYSWIGRTGDGYRYDYVFVNEALASRVMECEYLSTPREEGISDHAGVLMTLSARCELLDVRLSLGEQAALIG